MSSRRITAYGKIKDGKLTIEHRQYFDALLSEFDEGEVSIVVSQAKSTRSSRQNRYYWGVCVHSLTKYFNEEWTFGVKVTPDLVHELLKSRFLNQGTATLPTGEVLNINASTSALSTAEFIAYIEEVVMWSAQYIGLIIPPPNSDLRE